MAPFQRFMSSQKRSTARRLFSALWVTVTALAVTALSSYASYDTYHFWVRLDAVPMGLLCLVSYLTMVLVLRRLIRFPTVEAVGLLLLVVGIFASIVYLLVSVTRVYYSNTFIFTFFGTAFLLLWIWVNLRQGSPNLHLHVVPGGVTHELLQIPGLQNQVDIAILDTPDPEVLTDHAHGIIVDMAERREDEWVRFFSHCTLHGIEIYPAEEVFEAFTGRVSLVHLSEGVIEAFNVSPVYQMIKRVEGILFVLVSLPISLPLMILTAAAIRLDSPGPIVFTQNRVGQGGRAFRMHKFRSMAHTTGDHEAKFADTKDDRITKVGAFIRKFRLDELPQFWNILVGDMSLIGPRPEQVGFVERFETEIPYYAYRHLVKPGITGWAQVNHGYAADHEETRTKLEHDLYYVKHFSFWLDVLITFKTVKTIVTGFGAR
ncbi:MAG: sugar transferase [Spirochaetia bacterium]